MILVLSNTGDDYFKIERKKYKHQRIGKAVINHQCIRDGVCFFLAAQPLAPGMEADGSDYPLPGFWPGLNPRFSQPGAPT